MKPRRRALLAIPVALIAAILVWLVWPNGDGPTVMAAGAGPYRVQLSIDNPRLGTNAVHLTIADEKGRPPAAQSVSVNPVMPHMGHALPPVQATSDSPGSYRASVTLTMAGQWDITAVVPGAGQAVFPLLISG